MGGGESVDHLPVCCATADAAEVRANGGFGHVSAGIGSGLAADADLSGVVIAPEASVFGAERAVAVIHIIGLAGHCDVHSAAVASAAVRGGGGRVGHRA